MVKVLTPILYLLAYMTVLALSLLVVGTVERLWTPHSWYSKGDVDAVVACLFLGTVIFPLATLVMARLDGLQQPAFADHIRQSAAVYALTIASGVIVVADAEQRHSLGFGVAAGALLLGLYAAALNRVVLWLMKRPEVEPTGKSAHPMVRRNHSR